MFMDLDADLNKDKRERFSGTAASWMGALNGKLTLKDICLPATHLSGMYKVLNKETDTWASDCYQNLNIYEQLDYGVRCFDFSPQFITKAERNINRTSHLRDFHVYKEDFIGSSLAEILEDIRTFLTNNSSSGAETIILCFSDLKNFNKERTQLLFFLLKEKIGFWLLGKKMIGQQKISNVPLNYLRNKILVVFRTSGAGSIKLPLLRGEDFFWSEESLLGANESLEQSTIEEVKQQQLRRFIMFDQTDKLFVLNWRLMNSAKKPDIEVVHKLNQKLFSVNEKPNGSSPLFLTNPNQQKVNVISVDALQSTETLQACQRINQLQEEESSYIRFLQPNADYLIRPYTQVNQCLTIEEELIEEESSHNCLLQRCWSHKEASVGQVFTLSTKSNFQRKFTMSLEGLPSRPILTIRETTSKICATYVTISLIDFYWGIEPYFRPIRNAKGELIEYKRQKGCFLIFHSLQKQCLGVSQRMNKLILLPYEREQENLNLVWLFEKVQ